MNDHARPGVVDAEFEEHDVRQRPFRRPEPLTPYDFCRWLQGYIDRGPGPGLPEEQLQVIKAGLEAVLSVPLPIGIPFGIPFAPRPVPQEPPPPGHGG